jgi:hypothetical protein
VSSLMPNDHVILFLGATVRSVHKPYY